MNNTNPNPNQKENQMNSFLAVDKIIRDAYVAGDKDTLLRIAGALAMHAAEPDLSRALDALEVAA